MRTLIGDGSVEDLYAWPDGPWLRVNMISTVDGAAQGPDGLTEYRGDKNRWSIDGMPSFDGAPELTEFDAAGAAGAASTESARASS